MKVFLEDVFKTSGIPTYTFVKPAEYTKLKVALRSKGRGVIVEGPSGIGKTTCITKAIDELGMDGFILPLSSRKIDDLDYIKELPSLGGNLGIVIIDDFHRLPENVKKNLADYMKTLADEETEDTKLVLIGINKAGDTLIKFADDLNNRIDTIRFEINPREKIIELIEKGEEPLNITIEAKEDIIEEAKGSFHITQMLCKEACLVSDLTENSPEPRIIFSSIENIKNKVMAELERTFYEPAKQFSTGTKLRREGRAPYLHMLKWLSESEDWSIQMNDIIAQHPEIKGSISQVVEKGFLLNLVTGNPIIQKVIHFDPSSKVLSIEDPKFLFFIRNIAWSKFSRKVGFLGDRFSSRYDFALSFAGANRTLAEKIADELMENEVEVFYDLKEQHNILAENIEDYLAPIYSSEARYVIVLLSSEYPKRIWTKFESDQFKARFGENSVIPIWFSNTDPSLFDETRKYGGIRFNVDHDMDSEVKRICGLLLAKISENRQFDGE